MARTTKAQKARVSSVKQKKSFGASVRDYSFGQSRSYLFEYGLLLLVVGALVAVLMTMIEAVIAYVDSNRGTTVLAQSIGYTASEVLLSALLVLLPLTIVLFKRTRESEYANVQLKNIGWRKAFLGIFLATISISAIVATVGFVYQLVSLVAHLGLGGDSQFSWQSTLNAFLSVLLLGATAWLFGHDYRSTPSGYETMQRYYRYLLVAVAIVVGVIFVLVPMREQRSSYVDNRITQDLREIRAKIDEAQNRDGMLPPSLDNIKLSPEQRSNAKAYKYEYDRSKSGQKYTLCARFKTDTRDQDITNLPPIAYPLVGAAASTAFYTGDPSDPGRHNSGRECFDYTVNSYGLYGDSGQKESAPAPEMPNQPIQQLEQY